MLVNLEFLEYPYISNVFWERMKYILDGQQQISNGNYNFTKITAGSYKVEEVAAYGSVQTYPAGGSPHLITLGVGETVLDVNFGKSTVPPGEIRARNSMTQTGTDCVIQVRGE